MAEVNLKNHVLRFFAAVIGMWFIFLVITIFFKLNVLGGMIIIPLLASLFSGKSFVETYSRAPNDDEAKALTRVSFLYFFGFHLLLVIIALARLDVQAIFSLINATILTQIIIFVAFYFGISFFFIRWGFGSLTRKLAAQQNK